MSPEAASVVGRARCPRTDPRSLSYRWGHQHDLFVGRADGAGLRRLTNDGQGVRCPDWSPDESISLSAGRFRRMAALSSSKSRQGRSRPQRVCRTALLDVRGHRTVPGLSRRSADGTGEPTCSHGGSRVRHRPRTVSGARKASSPHGHGLRQPVARRHDRHAGSRCFPLRTGATVSSTGPGSPSRRRTRAGFRVDATSCFRGPLAPICWSPTSPLRPCRRVLSVRRNIRGASITRDGTQLVVSAGSEEGDIWMATLPPSR